MGSSVYLDYNGFRVDKNSRFKDKNKNLSVIANFGEVFKSKINNKNINSYINYGRALASLSQHKNAIEIYNQGIKINKNHVNH